MKKSFLLFFCLFTTLSGFAQFNWPEDKKTAQEKWILLDDGVKNGDFASARKAFRWLYENAPDLNKALYIRGTTVYETLQETAAGDEKNALQDTALMLYDARIKYFQEEANVLNRKGLVAFPYWQSRPEKYGELLALYNQIAELNGNDIYVQNVLPHMYLLCKQKEAGAVTDEQILTNYDRLNAAYEHNLAQNKAVDVWNEVKSQMDNMLTSCVTIDCDFVRKNLGPKFDADPKNIELAARIFNYMRSDKCTDDPLFMKAASLLAKEKPTHSLCMYLANKELNNKDLSSAIKYFQQAADLADTNKDKAEAHLEMAVVYQKMGQKPSARSSAQKAVSLDGSRREAYELIGDLYYNSYDQCTGGNPVESRLVFIAAYDQYAKAGNQKKMDMAKGQFPSKEEIFTYGMEKGQSKSSGCWVGETVTLQSRD